MSAVEVCPICDIADCAHIRERRAKASASAHTGCSYPGCITTGMACSGPCKLSMGTGSGPHFLTKPIPTGWLCPRCNRMNAPHVAACDCK